MNEHERNMSDFELELNNVVSEIESNMKKNAIEKNNLTLIR